MLSVSLTVYVPDDKNVVRYACVKSKSAPNVNEWHECDRHHIRYSNTQGSKQQC